MKPVSLVNVLLVAAGGVGLVGSVYAGDFPYAGRFAASATQPMPTLTSGMYGTKVGDTAAGNMGSYLCRSSSPIHFTINIPTTVPVGQSATLQMAVYDVDTSPSGTTSPEVDTVTVNGTKVGVLNGSNDTWFYNNFTVPVGLLKAGANAISVSIDDGNAGWCVQVDWAVLTLAGGGLISTGSIDIPRAWVSPTIVKGGTYINVFAEVSGGKNVAKVEVSYELSPGFYYPLTTLTDPDGDGTYSGQFQIPLGLAPGYYSAFRVIATDISGKQAKWPGITIVP